MPRISLSVIKTQFVTASRGAADRSVLSLPTIFSTCRPRADVLAGSVRDDEFMADLSRVVNSTPPRTTSTLPPSLQNATQHAG